MATNSSKKAAPAAKKAAAKATPAVKRAAANGKKAAPAAKKAAPAAKKAAPAAKKANVGKAAAASTAKKAAPADKKATAEKQATVNKPTNEKQPVKKQPLKKQPGVKPVVKPPAPPQERAPARGKKAPSKDGIVATKDFDLKFLRAQRDVLVSERVALTGQAIRLEDEANALIEDFETGDVQFDDESGEGDTMVVERERDLALSAQARQMIAEIDEALERIGTGDYGYSVQSGRPIPRERLEAIPWTAVLVEEKAGGIGRL
jgi:RNA polymerase-binding transcription factor DksA